MMAATTHQAWRLDAINAMRTITRNLDYVTRKLHRCATREVWSCKKEIQTPKDSLHVLVPFICKF